MKVRHFILKGLFISLKDAQMQIMDITWLENLMVMKKLSIIICWDGLLDVYDKYAVAGVPKVNALSSSICYLRGSLFQQWFCDDSIDATLNGQFVLYNKTTGSIPDTTNIDWDITNIYQIKKQFLSPYRVYGWDVDVLINLS